MCFTSKGSAGCVFDMNVRSKGRQLQMLFGLLILSYVIYMSKTLLSNNTNTEHSIVISCADTVWIKLFILQCHVHNISCKNI
jgi:hypothetical protein